MQVSRRASRRRARRRGGAQLGQRQRGDGRAGPARRAPHVRARGARASDCATDRRARVLDRAHRDPDADGRARGRHPEAVRRRSTADGGGDAAAGDADHRHRAQGGDRAAPAARSSAAWPRARRCCRPRWRRCSRCSRPTPRPIPRVLQRALARAVSETFDCLSVDGCRSTNDTVIVLANGRAGAVDAGRARRRAHRGVRLARRADGARRRRRDQARAGPRGRRPHRRPRRAIAARAVANSQLVQCSLNGGDAYWGRVLSELGASGAYHRSRSGRHRVQRRHGVPRRRRVRARRRRARARTWPAARSRSCATCAWRTARRRCSPPTSRTRTSTRTGARRDGARRASRSTIARRGRGREGDRPRRGAAVHPRVLGQDRRDQVRRPRDGRRRRSPTCSRPTSCSCASSG